MSRDHDNVNKLTESTYKNVMEQLNPGLRNLVNLGKNYEKSVAVMTLAGKVYFDAVSKIGETASVSPVSRELDWPQSARLATVSETGHSQRDWPQSARLATVSETGHSQRDWPQSARLATVSKTGPE
ncbi:unnamed protein product [Coregonus sp. 'balchen']|nr:unnamed protein product [Coregonus sp. 'balchen']